MVSGPGLCISKDNDRRLSLINQSYQTEIYGGKFMEFFNSAVTTLQTIVVGLGGALCVWGGINLLEGYGQDKPASNAHVP